MGCDGGTIPRRDELVRTKKKPEQKDKDSEREFRWSHCALTQRRLEQPIVACFKGKLYSKQSILEHLLEKSTAESCEHIKSMKDIKQLNLTPNPAYVDQKKQDASVGSGAQFICKLSSLEMSGNFRFIALWTCGCVMAERAFKQIKGNICAICQTPFLVEDVLILNGTEDDIEAMIIKKEIRNAKLKEKKKQKKQLITATQTTEAGEQTAKETSKEAAATNGTKNVPEMPKKKMTSVKRPIGVAKATLEDPELKKLKTGYSVAEDPKATDVYKSLFTTHSSEQNQTRAHWVTYNPFYN